MLIEICCEKMLDVYKKKFVRLTDDNKYTLEMSADIGTPGEMRHRYEISFCPFCGKPLQIVCGK